MAKIGAEEIREIVLGAVQERISSLFPCLRDEKDNLLKFFAGIFAQNPYFRIRFPLDGLGESALTTLRELSNGYFVVYCSKNIVEMAVNKFEKAFSLFGGEIEGIQEKSIEII